MDITVLLVVGISLPLATSSYHLSVEAALARIHQQNERRPTSKETIHSVLEQSHDIEDNCKEPADVMAIMSELILKMYSDAVNPLFNATFPILDRDVVSNLQPDNPDIDSIKRLCINGLFTAQKMRNRLKYADKIGSRDISPRQSEIAFCPWVYKRNHNINRFPVDMFEAQCMCDQCVSRVPVKRQKDDDRRNEQTTTGHCKPSFAPTVVIRKKCDDQSGEFMYDLDTENIATSCSCVYTDKE
ncbi:hypothetical protein MAR_010158 [Mya arenaria]|uniref:Uncharacterized protein n=1 Tax=Mya arenaria TaxID=6604 RepID=A0ABY7E1A8_MYAAR|nr:uncharacterized protein LOC128232556 [Mya arenaria]WAR03600.1 hypothetical protein MAR_010158 [Mya arenaria]